MAPIWEGCGAASGTAMGPIHHGLALGPGLHPQLEPQEVLREWGQPWVDKLVPGGTPGRAEPSLWVQPQGGERVGGPGPSCSSAARGQAGRVCRGLSGAVGGGEGPGQMSVAPGKGRALQLAGL